MFGIKQKDTDFLVFNGVNGDIGSYLFPPMTSNEFSKFIRRQPKDRQHRAERKATRRLYTEIDLGPREGIDPKNVAASGWGVIFARDADPNIRDALKELLNHRRNQVATQDENRYKEYFGPKGYRPRESKMDFLGRDGAGPGPADPKHVPYYLLIVGSPEAIPFEFQFQLDVQYAVGRIAFDTLDEYAQYAHSVVAAETMDPILPRRAAFFGVRNPDDPATAMSADHLVGPLADFTKKDQPSWIVETILQDDATKARLAQLVGGSKPPAFLFTASHGMGFNSGSPLQLKRQGALLCQDWPGPKKWQDRIPEAFYFSGEDVGDHAQIHGMITFHFACYGAGTPRFDDFARARKPIAPHPFVAHLPQRLLSHPKGGALAVIAHVERAWGYSFAWPGIGPQLATFEDTIKRLLEGHPVGSAMEHFTQRYADISLDLNEAQKRFTFSKRVDNRTLSGLWTANNDARNYVVIGDPAVKVQGAHSARQV